MAPRSTQVDLRIVSGSNFENEVITLDGNNGEANIGGQWANGRVKVNTADNQTICDINASQEYVKFKNSSGTTQAVLDCKSGNLYVTGKIHEGETSQSLDERFPS
jgi:hypothetical protein